MAKGHYNGIVVGGDSWKIEQKDKPDLTGYSYKVMVLDDLDEKTNLHTNVGLVSVGTPDKQFDPNIKYGSKVTFDGEFRDSYRGADGRESKAKMQYSNLRLVKGDK